MVFLGRCRKRVDDEPETDSSCPDKVSADDDGSETSSQATEVANIDDELDMMLEVILKLREDPEFAKQMYANCPRLQHLLNKHPDLRPIYEDPRLICINFEQVYRNAGGRLPEDLENETWFQRTKRKVLRTVKAITETRAFKVFKCLLLIKKVMGFLNPMKFVGCAKGCCASMCCFVEDAEDMLEEADGDADGDDPHKDTREAANRAADYMEDPDVQEEMNQIMENPETMEDAIEQNDQLRELRDSNPVCAELMSDPDSMKIITDPDNLRALGDAPELLEADFADGGFEPPETQVDYGGETDVAGVDEVPTEPQESGAMEVEAELEADEEEGMEGPTADDFEDVEYEESKGGSKARGKAAQQKKGQQQKGGQKGKFGGVTESAFGFLGGAIMGELVGDLPFGSGGDELEGIEVDEMETEEVPEVDAPDDAPEIDESAMEDAALAAMVGASVVAAATDADAIDDFADTAQDQVDNMEDVADEAEDDRNRDGRAAAAGAGVAVGADGKRSGNDNEEDEEEEDDGPKGFRGFLSSAATGIKDAAKESLMAAVIGEDATEFIIDDMAAEEEEEEEEEDDKKDSKKNNRDKESQSDVPTDEIEEPANASGGEGNFADSLDS